MGLLTKEMILKAQDFEKEEVEVAEWGGSVFIRSMTSEASDEVQQIFMRLSGVDEVSQNGSQVAIKDPEAMKGMKAKIVAYCLCDKNGDLLFAEEGDWQLLASRNSAVIDRLYDVAMRINRFTDESVEQEKKDLLTAHTGASNSSFAEH